jgi:hypothetical protein
VKDVCAWPALTLLPDGSINATLFSKPSHGQVAGAVAVWNRADGTSWTKRGLPKRRRSTLSIRGASRSWRPRNREGGDPFGPITHAERPPSRCGEGEGNR